MQHFIVVNKADLVSSEEKSTISQFMAKDHPGVPVHYTSALSRKGAAKGIRPLLVAAIDRVREKSPRLFKHGTPHTTAPASSASRAISEAAAKAAGGAMTSDSSLPIIMMVCGVPNVGKSSLINAFRQVSSQLMRGHVPSSHHPQQRTRSMKPARTGVLPGVTTALSGFQVSWDPSVWVLDTPGVLTPKVDGGWEAAMRLGILDLIKYGHDSIEGLGAYALYHLAKTDPRALERWPRAAELAQQGPEEFERSSPRRALVGSGADPFARAGQLDADDDRAACVNERFAHRLLMEVASDMGLWLQTSRFREERLPDTTDAAQRVLRMLRRGDLGPVCLDMSPPTLEAERRRAGARLASGSASAKSGQQSTGWGGTTSRAKKAKHRLV